VKTEDKKLVKGKKDILENLPVDFSAPNSPPESAF
jgi:hypothetical protein